jgi:hypothetical protein
LDQLNSYQIAEWQAYNRLEPIEPWVDDYKWASLMAHMTNLQTWAHAKRGYASKYTAEDFMPNWTGEEKPIKKQSWQEMKEFLLSFAKQQNKRVAKDKKLRDKVPLKQIKTEK